MNPTTPSSAPIRPPMGRTATVLLAASMLFYLVAMFTAPFRTGAPDPHPWADGWQVLLTGWMGVLGGIPAWLANPLVFGAWLMAVKRLRVQAAVLAALALLFGLSFLSQHQIVVNEAGTVEPVHLDAIGYWCWLASFGAALVGAVFLPGRTKGVAAG
ncbi:MAG: hypothetical protein IOC39_27040 [Burkholderia sp.]|nr:MULTISPECIES: hypothetical protein [Burkholderia]MBY8608269.1 hypothetical protein [Burkholderia arboris]MCA3780975.1 hypothetical protein [Burkholderia sp.]MCA3786653.1 hypothetical protein [Burkholderia sp.]MCA3796911.1 hypothetical protein [Burkholderia sp.]MCA3805675.1 hypothetical protein [Burkholderia sp.]